MVSTIEWAPKWRLQSDGSPHLSRGVSRPKASHLAQRPMSLPNSQRAVIDPEKVRDYLLSEAHPVGRFKETFFGALGYTRGRWEILRDDLLSLAYAGVAMPGKPSQARLAGPSRSMVF